MKRLLICLVLIFPIFVFSQLTEKDAEFLRIELSQKINQLRVSKKLKPLTLNDTLRNAAQFHSEYMAKKGVLTHNENQSKFSNPQKRIDAFGGTDFDIVGENVLFSTAQTFPMTEETLHLLAEEMFQIWKNSKPHFANMINKEYVFADLGFSTDLKKGNVYVTHVFGMKFK